MIRLWNRVGWYRVLAVVLLVGAVAGGVSAAADRSTQRPAVASGAVPDQAAEQKQPADAQRAEAERAARHDAQRKAEEAAASAAETAKATAKPSSSPTPKPSTSTSPAPRKPLPPIPASCAVYSGNKAIGCAAVLNAGWNLQEMGCLEKLWDKESHWNPLAHNSSSGAHGIPQALPGSRMGPGWQSDPVVQINWGIGYIKGRYDRPCVAWAHSQSTGWY